MMLRLAPWLIAAALTAAPGLAADRPAMADVHRLSPAEVKAILDTAAARRDTAPPPEGRQIEGVIGIGIGTGGTREAFGTAVVPLGRDATAILSVDTASSDRGQVRRHR